MKKVLIISYYWPPSGGSGVQRWLKMSKYLPEFGWEPIILTPENPSFINEDPSLLKDVSEDLEVLKLPIWEPYKLFGWFKGKKQVHQKEVNLSAKKKTFTERIALWVRGNILIPDPRIFWVNPVVRFLNQYLPDSGINHIITTGPPHSLHLIGLKIKKKHGIKWIADFRDPWSEYDLLDSFSLSAWARKKHQVLERKVITSADCVLSVGWQMDSDLKRLGATQTEIVTNGFDHADFEKAQSKNIAPENKIFIRHIGSIDELRNPRPFIEALSELIEEGKLEKESISLEFIGNVNPTLMEDVNSRTNWAEIVEFKPYIPHSELIKLYSKTDILLLVLAHSHSARLNVTGKIFEYIASGVPVLGIGDPSGDAASILKGAEAGEIIEANDRMKIKSRIIDFLKNRSKNSPGDENSPFSRKSLARKISNILTQL